MVCHTIMNYSVIYRSKAEPSFKLSDVKEMLKLAQEKNAEHNVTGCLLYHKNQFLQLIEGEEATIKRLYANILYDRRHYDIKTVMERHTDTTLWSDWAMAFYDMSNNRKGNVNHNKLLMEGYVNRLKSVKQDSEVLETLKKETSLILDY